MTEPNPFSKKVIAVIRKIPKGRVATYQQVAGLAGRIHASRAIAWILNSMSKKHKLPWQRVISKQGRIAFKAQTSHFLLQRRLLQSEGVHVDKNSGKIDLERFQWKKAAKVRHKKGQPRMFS